MVKTQYLPSVIEYTAELEKAEVVKKANFAIAFNGQFLTEILNYQDWNEPVKIKMWGETKAAIINESFLIMPLMLCQ